MTISDFPAPSLRPICDADMSLLLAIYASTRAAEMALTPFSEIQKAAFLQMQFNAQHTHYQTHYPQAAFDCIVQGEKVIGRLYVDRHPGEIRIMDISLLPEYCQQRIGSHFMQQLITEAEQAGARLTAHVEHANPARAWYARLGFQELEERGPYLFVVKESGQAAASLSSQTSIFVENSNG